MAELSQNLPSFEETEPVNQALPAFQDTEPTEQDKAREQAKKHDTLADTLTATAEGALSGATMGLGTGLERSLGVGTGDIEERRIAHPIANTVGQVAGFTLGPGKLARGAELTGLAAKEALTAAAFQAQDEYSRMLSGDPQQSLGSAIVNVGLAGVLGGALGATGGKLAESSVGKKLSGWLNGFKSRAGGTLTYDEVQELTSPAAKRGAIDAGKLIKDALLTGASYEVGKETGHPYLGLLLGHRSGARLAKSIIPALIKPLLEKATDSQAFRAAVNYGMQAIKGEDLLDKAIQGVIRGTETGIAIEHKDIEKLDKQMQRLSEEPAHLAAVGEDLAHYAPDHSTALVSTATNALSYLSQQRPRTITTAPLSPPIEPTDVQMAAYRRTLAIAQQPLQVLQHVKDGTLIPKDVADLNALYPGLHSKMITKFTQSTLDHMSEGEAVPYHVRASLSLLAAQPLDATFTPEAIQSAQLTYLKQQQPTQPAQQPKQKQSKSAGSLTKSAEQYRTPEQARAERRATNR